MESRIIKRNIYILIGVTFVLLAGMSAGWYFGLMKPLKEKTATTLQQYEARKAVADQLPQNLAAQKQAEDRVVYVNGQLAYFRQRYRNLQFGDLGDPANLTPVQKAARIQAWRAVMNEFYSGYNNALRNTLVSVANETDVSINIAPPKVDAPPKAPEDLVVPANGFYRPTSASGGGVLNTTITGSLSNIMRFFNRINTSSILMVIGTVKLDDAGTGGNAGQAAAGQAGAAARYVGPNRIRATFSITPYLLAAGSGAKISVGGAAPAAPAAPAPADPGAPAPAVP